MLFRVEANDSMNMEWEAVENGVYPVYVSEGAAWRRGGIAVRLPLGECSIMRGSSAG